MREIKFRGKRIGNGEWVYGNLAGKVNSLDGNTIPCIQVMTHRPDSTNRWIEVFDSELIEVIPESVGQFTDFQDVHEEDIYEGNIIRFIDHDSEIHGFEYDVVIWNDSEGQWYLKNYGVPLADHLHLVEVVGTIHENPELLKGGE